ncbi:MAG: DUF4416 family protein [Candidatus Marinimicrobia bacterium]|nr:DUF4416 family protein [Candidatus Neomarinimicrobiota bacterium]
MIKIPKEVLLFQAITVNDPALFGELEKLLCRFYGKIERELGPLDFSSFSQYYREEMGNNLLKKFYVFSLPVSLENFYRYKLESQAIENKYSINGKRTVNIDPGSLTLYQLSLLTTKAFSHRTYLAEGIYAECTLIAKGNEYGALPWTYPDYKTTEALEFFRLAKKYLKAHL